MKGKWYGTPKTDIELAFWKDAFIQMAVKHIDIRHRDDKGKAWEEQLTTIADVADTMLDHFQTMRESMEDYQAEITTTTP